MPGVMLLKGMRFNLKILLYVSLIYFSAVANAEEIFLSELNSWLVVTEEGPAHSDNIILKVSLLNKEKTSKVVFPDMVGEIYISETNAQIFSCESNSIKATKSAFALDLKGSKVFSFEHLGFVRGCGVTKDKKIYWLHYNKVENNNPVNVFVALSKSGQTLHKESFRKSKIVTFLHDNNQYTVGVPNADWPG